MVTVISRQFAPLRRGSSSRYDGIGDVILTGADDGGGDRRRDDRHVAHGVVAVSSHPVVRSAVVYPARRGVVPGGADHAVRGVEPRRRHPPQRVRHRGAVAHPVVAARGHQVPQILVVLAGGSRGVVVRHLQHVVRQIVGVDGDVEQPSVVGQRRHHGIALAVLGATHGKVAARERPRSTPYRLLTQLLAARTKVCSALRYDYAFHCRITAQTTLARAPINR